jgi:hypothetical protein
MRTIEPTYMKAPLMRASLVFAFTVVLAAVAFSMVVPGASAAAPAARLTIDSFATPTSFSGADAVCLSGAISEEGQRVCDSLRVSVTNAGSVSSEAPTVIKDTVPAGLVVQSAQLDPGEGECEVSGQVVTCNGEDGQPPDGTLEAIIYVTVEPGAVGGLANVASATGGMLPEVSATTSDVLDSVPAFGFNSFTGYIAGVDGAADSQAGDHPYEFTTRFDLNTDLRRGPIKEVFPTSVQDVRDLRVDLPLGFVGGTVGIPQCTFSQLSSPAQCPKDTEVGHIVTEPVGPVSVNGPIYSMVPEHGVAAEYGFRDALASPHVIYANIVPTEAGYVAQASSPEVGQIDLNDVVATFYGDPASKNGGGSTHAAMFTNPADCSGEPLFTRAEMDSWQNPGNFVGASSQSPPVTGCNQLRFAPSAFKVQPDTTAADSASGLNFDLQVPQSETPGTLATPPLRNASVTLPAGLTINPSAAGGLAACSEAQIGWLGHSLSDFTATAPDCPDASKVGTVEVTSPLLAGKLEGSIYLAAENENPFHSLLAGYIVIDDPTTGIIVKIPGELKTNAATGQITGVFDDNPQLPFSDLKLRFDGGARGVLATPETCGTYTTSSVLEPWSAPASGPPAQPSDSFQINAGCTPGFGPAFTAGTTNPQAGAYSPFVLSFSRQDSEQGLSGLSVTLPPGLVGRLAGISQCSDAQLTAAANNPSGASEQSNPSCPANSRVGSVQSAAGVGSQPFSLGGSAYLTGPYKGAPYGIAVVVPAVAGPFDLGNVVVRSKLEIDPNDAHVTVTSDPFPQVIDANGADGKTNGFPIHLRSIQVTMDRPSFTLNPTNCDPLTVTGALTSANGTVTPVASHFQAASCASLAFKPVFSASTSGRASKAGGASLDVKVAYPTGPLGTYANIKSVKVDLPKQLPSRLTTLQKACLAKVFEANPAGCPEASDVGTATASTPLLSNPLIGPAYLVSHGGEAFPDLEIVLQGEGVKLILDGNTKIKNGITSSTFKAIPDAPVSGFELKLPTGKDSILGSNVPESAHYSLCGQTLKMPTAITAQNGAVIKQTTKIGIAGCSKKKPAKKVKKKAAPKRKGRK